MCGIAGIFNLNQHPIELPELMAMTKRLRHRGPDHFGYFADDVIGLGHARLSIIDLDGGRQPIFNEDKTIAIVFNGEIYNFKALRKDLQAEGHQFSTSSDTEVIVHLYEQYGPECVKQLRGMFAFAIWDDNKKSLFLARDPLGEKPIFYTISRERFLFASEMKALLAIKDLEKDINLAAIDAYLSYQHIPDPMTIFKDIYKLPPGTWASHDGKRLLLQRYWQPPVSGPEAQALDEAAFDELLTEAVSLRLMSDVPLGAFLSGGLDSALIVSKMAALMDRPVKTFTVGFSDPSFDESREAAHTAAFLGTDHHTEKLEMAPEALLEKLIRHFDEPFADPSALPTYCLSEQTRKGVTVALSGDGADELFAGYRRYTARKLIDYYEKLPAPLRGKWIDQIDHILPEGSAYYGGSFRKKMHLFLEAYHRSEMQPVLLWTPLFTSEEKKSLYGREMARFMSASQEEDPVMKCVHEAKGQGLDAISEMLWVDLQTYLPNGILVKVDRMSMAHGLEVRPPFLDLRLVEAVSRMPLSQKLNGFTTKVLLRKIAKNHVPPEVLKRSKKGFNLPLGAWFKGPLKRMLHEELLRSEAGWDRLFRRDYIEALLESHERGQTDHSLRLWGLLILRLWYKKEIEGLKGPRHEYRTSPQRR